MSAYKKGLHAYRDIVSRVRIEHGAYAATLNELTEAYEDIGHTATPICLLITGESRTGKSSVVRDFLDMHVPDRVDDQQVQSVVYAVAPAKATLKSLLESLLKGLGDPYWSRGTESKMTQRLYTLLDAVNCRMIILDEFQHLCDKGQKRKLDQMSDWLKVLLETCRYGLVAVGLPGSASVIHRHPQLTGRFDGALHMPVFDWQDKASALQFRGILQKFQRELHPFELPPLDSRDIALRFYLASAGRIGLVAKLLDRAVREAIRAGTPQIRLKDLSQAYDRAIWLADQFPVRGGPFGAELDALSHAGVRETVMANASSEEVADESGAVEIHGQRAQSINYVSEKGQPKRGQRSPTRAGLQRELDKAFSC